MLGHFFSAIAMMLVLAAAASAQSGATPATRPRLDPFQREQQRRIESEAIEQALAERPRLRDKRQQRFVLAQIKEDFLQIQVVNNGLQETAARSAPSDLKTISKSAVEINKRAARLKENLSLPAVGAADSISSSDSGTETLPGLVTALGKSIEMFVENPVFEKLGVIDAKLSAKASRDLEEIILVSQRVKRIAEKLERGRTR
jgi:hypothetical protein